MYKFNANKLQRAMEQAGLNQSSLSRLLGYNRSTVNRLLSGEARFTDRVQVKLNQVFGNILNEEMTLKKLQELKLILEGEDK